MHYPSLGEFELIRSTLAPFRICHPCSRFRFRRVRRRRHGRRLRPRSWSGMMLDDSTRARALLSKRRGDRFRCVDVGIPDRYLASHAVSAHGPPRPSALTEVDQPESCQVEPVRPAAHICQYALSRSLTSRSRKRVNSDAIAAATGVRETTASSESRGRRSPQGRAPACTRRRR